MTVPVTEPSKVSAKNSNTLLVNPTKPHLPVSRKAGKPQNPRRSHKNLKTPQVRRGTKTAKILQLLRRPQGASLAELTKATKWQAHSVRGFLSGSVKAKLHLKITSIKRDDGARAYRVPSA